MNLDAFVLPLAISTYGVWVVAVGALAGVACAVLGSFLVLRRAAMLGDAVSHSVLPGIAIAFLVTGSRSVLPMLVGAGIAGLVAALLAAALRRHARVAEDSALGVVFTSMFALGVILITFVASRIDLDPGCVLYGNIEQVPLDTLHILGADVPRVALTIAAVMTLDLILVALFFKELTLFSFDPAYGASLGFGGALVHYGLMAAVAATCVACFEAVGTVLVVAMLIAPGAAAHMITDRLARLLIIASLLALVAAGAGYALAVQFDSSTAGMMSVVAGVEFALAALLGPRHGVLARVIGRLLLSVRIRREDLLATLFRVEEAGPGGGAPAVSIRQGRGVEGGGSGGVLGRVAIFLARRAGHITVSPAGDAMLTEAGREAGRRVIRSHRLWESFLCEQGGLPPDHVHDASHVMEHFVTTDMAGELAGKYADRPDPHGRPVPPEPERPR